MCGRVTFHHDDKDIRAWLDSDDDAPIQPSFNFAPTQQVPVIRANEEGVRHLVAMRWGLIPSWAKDHKIGNKLINARADTVAIKPAFRAAFKRRRCLVPMSGYYEWHSGDDGKVPHLIKAEGPIAAAGLWESWTDPTTEARIETCTIITSEAAPSLMALHPRMPVLVPAAAHRVWLAVETPLELVSQLLLPLEGLTVTPVSKRLNNPRNHGADLLLPD